MSEMRSFDVIVVGAGPAGEVCAGRLADHGLSVAIVEHELVGGECSFWACMPSKALLRPADVLAEARRVPGAAEAVTGRLDVAAVLARRDEVIHDLDDAAQVPWLEDKHITLIRGRAELCGPSEVIVDGEHVHADRAIVLATGSSAAVPPIPGLAAARPWTSREATNAAAIPDRLVVIGGGVVGVEMAQAHRSLGAEVVLLGASERLLPREESFAGDDVADGLRRNGVDVRLSTRATRVERAADGTVTVELGDGDSVRGDEILVAVGRTPNTSDLGLERVGLEAGMSIDVDDHMAVVDHRGLYAIGDVNGRALLTHMGKYQARIAADHILGQPTSVRNGARGRLSPRVVFTDPQVAAVGHTLESALGAGLEARAVDVPTSGSAGASFVGRNTPGTARIVIDDGHRVLVGATFTGFEVADLLHAATIAVVARISLDDLWHAVPSFPTRSEVWLKLLETAGL